MRRSLPALALAALLCLPASAGAAPIPGATYGGGAFAPDDTGNDSTVVSAGVGADGQTVRVVANAVVNCGKGRVATQQLAADGSLGSDGRLRLTAATRKYEYNIKGARPRGTGTLDLGFDGATASGTLVMETRRRGRACSSTLPVQLRAVGPDTSALAPPAPGAPLFGTGSARYLGAAVPVAIAVDPSGERVTVAMVGVPVRCRRITDYLVNYSPSMRIRSDGRFSRAERLVTRFAGGARSVTRFKLSGRFTEQGARGTYSARLRSTTPGRRPVTCRAGVIRWTAIR